MTLSSKVRPEGAELAGLLGGDQGIDGLVDLVLGHVALVAVLDVAPGFERHGGVHDADLGHVDQRGLAGELGIEQLVPVLDRPLDQVGPKAQRVGVVDGRDRGRVAGRPLGERLVARLLDVLDLVGVDALARDLAAVRILALGEDRHDLVPPLVLLEVDRLDDAARHRVHQEEELGIGDVEGFRLADQPVQERGVVGGLHLDLEAQVLARLAGDVDDRRVGAADLEQRHVLDVLRPDRREAGERARARGEAGARGGALEDRAPAPAAGAAGRHDGTARDRRSLVGHQSLLGIPEVGPARRPGAALCAARAGRRPDRLPPRLAAILPPRRPDRKRRNRAPPRIARTGRARRLIRRWPAPVPAPRGRRSARSRSRAEASSGSRARSPGSPWRPSGTHPARRSRGRHSRDRPSAPR